jgi:hypothetical protein
MYMFRALRCGGSSDLGLRESDHWTLASTVDHDVPETNRLFVSSFLSLLLSFFIFKSAPAFAQANAIQGERRGSINQTQSSTL